MNSSKPATTTDGELHHQKLRVLFVDNSFTFGGAILSLAELVSALPDHGIAPVVMSAQTPDVLQRLFPSAPWCSIALPQPWVHGDPFIRDPRSGSTAALGPLARAGRSLYWLVRGELNHAFQIGRVARQHDVHLIHLNNTAESQAGGAIAARALGLPCVSHMRQAHGKVYRSSRLRNRLPHHHVAISSSVRDSMVAVGMPPERISVIHNSVNLADFVPAAPSTALRSALGIPEAARVVGVFGRIVPFKGILEFLHAFALVAREAPSAVALIVGDRSDGPEEYEQRVHALVRELGLKDRVIFAGFRSDIAEVLRLCDVLALTSLGPEGFGRVLVEAMSVGVPVVASGYGGPLDIVRDGVDGYLRDPRDAAAFGEALTSLLQDEALRRRMGAAGREHAVKTFSTQAMAAKVAGLYRTLLSRSTLNR